MICDKPEQGLKLCTYSYEFLRAKVEENPIGSGYQMTFDIAGRAIGFDSEEMAKTLKSGCVHMLTAWTGRLRIWFEASASIPCFHFESDDTLFHKERDYKRKKSGRAGRRKAESAQLSYRRRRRSYKMERLLE